MSTWTVEVREKGMWREERVEGLPVHRGGLKSADSLARALSKSHGAGNVRIVQIPEPKPPRALTPEERLAASRAAEQVRAHSKRAARLVEECWRGYRSKEGEPDPEAAECLLAAVDEAARAAREMLEAMGQQRQVAKWEAKARAYAG